MEGKVSEKKEIAQVMYKYLKLVLKHSRPT